MCGRYTLRTPAEAWARQFQLFDPPVIRPRYNIAPTQQALVVRDSEAGRAAVEMRWGLVPSWADDLAIGARMINARAETVATKPSFRSALAKRRCLIPADGFYEWRADGKKKQPFYFCLAEESVFAFAGLWETWSKGPQPVVTFTIITTEANHLLRDFHNRMPVILPPEQYDRWLDTESVLAAEATTLLLPYPDVAMKSRAANPVVNAVRNDSPDCLANHVAAPGTLFDL